MRVMMMFKADPDPGARPARNSWPRWAGTTRNYSRPVCSSTSGLLPSAVGRRVRFSGGNRTVIDGPFPDPKQVIAGYWILQVQSMDEAVEWAERFPFEALSRIYPGESTAPQASSSFRQVFEPEG